MASRSTHAFSSVSVGLPAKVRGSEAEEEWQEVDWVTWSTGDLSVDTESFLLVFKPTGPGSSSANKKPLGNLLRAHTVGEDDDAQRTLVVATSDAVQGQYRFTFSDVRVAADFKVIADTVEAAHAAALRKGTEAGTRSNSGGPRAAQLAAAIQEKYAGRWPLVFSAADLYGPNQGGEAGSEVLLGRGAAVLLDPEENVRTIGEYSLLFFGEDEGASRPIKTFPIGPRMSLQRKQPDAEDAADPDGPFAMFEFRAGRDMPAHLLSFDEEAVAATFSRDFRVRSRLLDVSLKTAKGQSAVNDARDELRVLQRNSLGARLRRLIRLIMFLLVVAIIVRIVMLYREQPGKEPQVYVQHVKKDITNAVHASFAVVTAAGSKACEFAVGAVAVADLQKCLAVGGVSKVRECVEDLVYRAAS